MKRHQELPKALWNKERAAAYHFMALSYEVLGDKQNALASARLATVEDSESREWWIHLGKLCLRTGDFGEALEAVDKASGITAQDHSYLTERYAWQEGPDDLRAVAYFNLGQRELALAHAKQALELNPSDLRLQNNVVLMT